MKPTKGPLFYSAIGGITGYLILHPFVMMVSILMRGESGFVIVGEAFEMSFSPFMMPWSINFFLLGAVIGYLVWRVKSGIIKLERANELKRLFTDIIAHDISNPLTVASMNTEMILAEERSEATKNKLDRIIQALEDAEEILRDAREYSLVLDETELEFNRVDLGEIIQEVLDKFSPILKKKDMVVNYDRKELFVEVNPRIRDVFSNILSNTIKYSPPGTEIGIKLEEIGTSIKIAFVDQGEGIPDEFKDSIFNRFERIDREGVKGSGIGLGIVKKIVEIHNGKVWVEDNPEGGSIFYIEFPKQIPK